MDEVMGYVKHLLVNGSAL